MLKTANPQDGLERAAALIAQQHALHRQRCALLR
jgi:hypothetical protein